MSLGRHHWPLTARRSVFDTRPVFVRFVVERVALGQGFLLSRFSPLPIIPPMLHTLLGYMLTLTGKTNE